MAEKKGSVITAALHEVYAKVGYVQKKGENKFHGYKYASAAGVVGAVRPAMVEVGLMTIPNVRSISEIDQYGNTTVQVEYTLVHKDGEVWPEKIHAVGTGNDRNSKGGVGDKGYYKALTGANKSMLVVLLQLETGEDPEATEAAEAPAATITDAQKDELVTLIKETGADVEKLLKYYKVPYIDELSASAFDGAKKLLEKKKATANG